MKIRVSNENLEPAYLEVDVEEMWVTLSLSPEDGLTEKEKKKIVQEEFDRQFNRPDYNYHTFASEEETTEVEEEKEEKSTADTSEAVKEPITVKNNSDFQSLMKTKDPDEDAISEFANKYEFKVLEFDGNVKYKEDGTDRLLIWYGDYDANNEVSHNGPEMLLYYVDDSKFKTGDNVHIKASLEPYKDMSYMIYLDCEDISKR